MPIPPGSATRCKPGSGQANQGKCDVAAYESPFKPKKGTWLNIFPRAENRVGPARSSPSIPSDTGSLEDFASRLFAMRMMVPPDPGWGTMRGGFAPGGASGSRLLVGRTPTQRRGRIGYTGSAGMFRWTAVWAG
jgi:hypothetical protein